MVSKTKSNDVFFLGLLAGLIFWVLDGVVDATFFEEDESILESIFTPHAHEIYMRGLVLILISAVSIYARKLLRNQENINEILDNHSSNLEKMVSIRTQALERLATFDDLTQIYNRRKFYEIAEYEIERSKRYKNPLSFIMIDIDHFKSINDTYGHDVGDITLFTFSEVITSLVRKTDVFGRVGGEEFALLMPETNKESAIILAEKLRLYIENEKFDKIKPITISLGVTQCLENDDIESIFKRADQALYTAKNEGRNRILAN